MIVSYDGALLRSLALEQAVAAERLGDAAAGWLHALLAEVEAAETADDILSLHGDAVTGDRDSLSVSLGPELTASFRVVREKGAFDAAGNPVWHAVRRLKLTGVDADGHAG